jgi:spore germination cell wall hydrolase CwlJ-like protein
MTRLAAIGMLCGAAYAAMTPGVFGPLPDLSSALPETIEIAQATLSYAAPARPVIDGSVTDLFATAIFTGPNRSAKTDRVRPQVDVVAFARSFEDTRREIAALRAPAGDVIGLNQSQIADAGDEAEAFGPRMSVAALDPSAAAALDAIAGIAPTAPTSTLAPGPTTPMPAMASEQLAFARANAPITGGFDRGEAIATNERELWCLATAIYFEARGEPYRGQVAVAQVVQNRVEDHRYPDSICGVVFQNQNRRNACQFSFACDGIPETINDQRSWAQAEDIAKRFMAGELYLTEVGTATHYHATYVRPAWAPRMTKLTQIGLHVFYKFKSGWLFG